MLIINSLKPFYLEEKNRIIRMGNFKNNGKEIEYEDDSLLVLFNNLKEPISKTNLIKKTSKETGLSEADVEDAIEYLISESFIINYDGYNNLLKDDRLSRQNLYFSMVSNNIKEWTVNKQPNILVLGLGGVGSNVSVILSRSGFKNFTLVDCDVVEESNLIRQLPYSIKDVGKNKTEVLKNIIDNESNHIDIFNIKILENSDIEKQIEKSDFVICTLDKPSRVIRRLINNLCVKYNKPVIFSGFAEHVAMIGPFVVPNETACLKCIEKELDEKPFNNVSVTPSYGPLCFMISSIVANEVVNYFYHFNENSLKGKTMMFNMLSYEQEIIEWNKNMECEVCSHDSK